MVSYFVCNKYIKKNLHYITNFKGFLFQLYKTFTSGNIL